ncbi:uncharacterized protein LOC136036957 isoform X2 [Artemia franciscana]|uniref:Uncharacterized protein n=2 Tax=Artemia franciscana TaxID=6661 RepID=A0AA88I0Z7_ARTSF|nr:hypothetical protein QYM36_005179 [Artemia franciscana]
MMKSMEDSGIKISEGILKRAIESASNTERPSKSAPKQSRFLSRKLVSSDIHKGEVSKVTPTQRHPDLVSVAVCTSPTKQNPGLGRTHLIFRQDSVTTPTPPRKQNQVKQEEKLRLPTKRASSSPHIPSLSFKAPAVSGKTADTYYKSYSMPNTCYVSRRKKTQTLNLSIPFNSEEESLLRDVDNWSIVDPTDIAAPNVLKNHRCLKKSDEKATNQRMAKEQKFNDQPIGSKELLSKPRAEEDTLISKLKNLDLDLNFYEVTRIFTPTEEKEDNEKSLKSSDFDHISSIVQKPRLHCQNAILQLSSRYRDAITQLNKEKQEELIEVFRKLQNKGLQVDVETVMRGLLSPEELRLCLS